MGQVLTKEVIQVGKSGKGGSGKGGGGKKC